MLGGLFLNTLHKFASHSNKRCMGVSLVYGNNFLLQFSDDMILWYIARILFLSLCQSGWFLAKWRGLPRLLVLFLQILVPFHLYHISHNVKWFLHCKSFIPIMDSIRGFQSQLSQNNIGRVSQKKQRKEKNCLKRLNKFVQFQDIGYFGY